MITHVAAVDLGASSGRVMLAGYDSASRKLQLEEVHRFENRLYQRQGHDCWDLDTLYAEILAGLTAIEGRGIDLASVGIDTWGVDFVLLDRDGNRLGEAVAYRDGRTQGVMAKVLNRISKAEVYYRTGIQFLQFNTLYQLKALINEAPAWLDQVSDLLMVPDYLHYRLCGVKSSEYTNATTTQLLNVYTGQWDETLLATIGTPASWFLPPVQPGTVLGEWVSPAGKPVKVIVPPTHDTGAAIAATPLTGAHAAYISSGTWSLIGIESPTPVNGTPALAANLTNEGGVEGTFRVLKNIMGLWLIQRLKAELGGYSFAGLVEEARRAEPFEYLINPNDDRFLNPTSMTAAIQQFCQETGQGRPETPGELARCVYESLALLYKQAVLELEAVTNRRIDVIHIVGGGSQNVFLNQLCADFCQLPIATGPVEASALGNVGYQLKGLGLLKDLDELRGLIGREFGGRRCHPQIKDSAELDMHWQFFQQLCKPATHPELSCEEVTA